KWRVCRRYGGKIIRAIDWSYWRAQLSAQRFSKPAQPGGAHWLSLHPPHGRESLQRRGRTLLLACLLAQTQALCVANSGSFMSALIQGYAPQNRECMRASALVPQCPADGQTLVAQLCRSFGIALCERDNGQVREPARYSAKIAQFARDCQALLAQRGRALCVPKIQNRQPQTG